MNEPLARKTARFPREVRDAYNKVRNQSMESLNILVTGGAGFIGSYLVEALVAAGHRVRVLDLLVQQVHEGNPPQYLPPEVEFLHGDVCDPQLLSRALDGIDAVFHEAAEVGVGQSMYEMQRYVRANDLGTAA